MASVIKIESSDLYGMLNLSSSPESESLSATPVVLDGSGVQVAVADVPVISTDAPEGVVAWAGHATYGSYLGSVTVCYGTMLAV